MLKRILACDLMTRHVRRLTMNAPVRDAAEFMLRWGISGAPVIDGHGQWKGVFTLNDLARHVQERLTGRRGNGGDGARSLENREPPPAVTKLEGLDDARVGDLMTVGTWSVFAEATFEEVVRTLVSQRIHRVFVLSDDGKEVLGVITTMDILRHLLRDAKEA